MINKLLFLIFLFVFNITLTSCARFKFQANRDSDRQIFFNSHKDDVIEYQKPFTGHFYFWGLYPKKQVIYVDELLKGSGNSSVSNLSITMRRNVMSYVLTFATLGFYYPVNGEISVFGPKKTQKFNFEHEEWNEQ